MHKKRGIVKITLENPSFIYKVEQVWLCVKSWCISQDSDRVNLTELSFSWTYECYSKDTAPFLDLMEKDKLRNVLADLTAQEQSAELQYGGKDSLTKNSHFTNGAGATSYPQTHTSPPSRHILFSAAFWEH